MINLSTNLVTHRLTVKTMGGYKSFLITQAEKDQITATLNNPKAPALGIRNEVYQKMGCQIEKIPEGELKQMRCPFVDYLDENFLERKLVNGQERTIMLIKHIRKFNNGKEEVSEEEKGYYEKGKFIKIS